MNQQKQVKSSGIFLLELILAIFFFSLASAVCVQIFVKASLLSRQSTTLYFAVNECSALAEQISVSGSMEQMNLSDLYYDENYSPCNANESTYRLHITWKDLSPGITDTDSSFHTLSVSLVFEETGGNGQIYNLEIIHHFAQEVRP